MKTAFRAWVGLSLLLCCANGQSAEEGAEFYVNAGRGFQILVPDGWAQHEVLFCCSKGSYPRGR